MKLLIAIVQDEDASRLLTRLMDHGIGVTKLATTGGFLRAGNTTMLIGVSDEQVDETIHLIEEVCRARRTTTTAPSPISSLGGGFTPLPLEVTIGGATVFVLQVESFVKV